MSSGPVEGMTFSVGDIGTFCLSPWVMEAIESKDPVRIRQACKEAWLDLPEGFRINEAMVELLKAGSGIDVSREVEAALLAWDRAELRLMRRSVASLLYEDEPMDISFQTRRKSKPRIELICSTESDPSGRMRRRFTARFCHPTF